jgi:glycosyl transferase, family 25
MRAYIINLERAKDRWSAVESAFAPTALELQRIEAVDGATLSLPCAEFAERRFRWCHGRSTNPREIGCYLSHIAALRAFLATDEEYALIGEDDVRLQVDLEAVLESALRYADHWNILRLSGLSNGRPMRVARLAGGYSLNVSIGRMKGLGAYVVDRTAARRWAEGALPMWLPIDHALDREWFGGLRAFSILPFPVLQEGSGFRSSIQVGNAVKLSSLRRWLTTHPYQAVNEMFRWLFRLLSYGRIKFALRGARKIRIAGAGKEKAASEWVK